MAYTFAEITRKRYSDIRISSKIITDLILAFECFTVFFSAWAAHLIYVHQLLGQAETFEKYFYHAIAASALYYYLATQRKLYTPKALNSPLNTTFPTLSALAISLLLLVLVGYLFKFAHVFSRGWMLTWFSLGAVMLVFGRLVISRLFAWLIRRGYFHRRVAVVGTAENANTLLECLHVSEPGVQLVGIFSVADQSTEGEEPSYHSTIDLIRLGQMNAFDEVYVMSSLDRSEEVKRAIRALRVLPVAVKICPPEMKLGMPIQDCETVGSYTAFSVQNRPISEWGGLLKSIEDYLIGGLALVALAPMFAVIAVAIKLNTRGPVFFRQRRHGFNHKVIDVWKFRTMTVAENGDDVVQATRDDVRVTAVGRILRRTSIDELPQLINVVLGEMSLVGPRPHALSHNQYYSELIETYGTRHRVKPGITGWAQINGFRGPTDDSELMRQRVAFDQFYIENWSLMFDIKILLATPIYGFVNKNAF